MRPLLHYLLDRPLAALLPAAMTVLLGAYALLHLSVDLFPDLDVPVVNLITHAPELAAQDMDMLVTRPLVEALRAAPGIQRVASSSQQGISVVTAQLGWGRSVDSARQAATAALAQTAPLLPAGVVPRIEQIGTTLQQVGGWAVSAPGDPVALGSVLRRVVAPRLMGLDGVAMVEVLGGERPALWADADPARLAALGIGVDDLMTAIRHTHGAAAAGFVHRSSEDVVVRADSRLRDVADLAAVPVRLPDGRMTRLDTLATVHAGRAPRHSEVRCDDRPAVALMVRKVPGSSTIAVVERVRDELARLHSVLPAGAEVRPFYDQSEVLVEARRAIGQELLVGAALAVGVLWFLLGDRRATLAVTATIPLALFATVAVLWMLGESLNVVTLAGLTLAVGMVVDDAIVVAENVHRHLQPGTPAPAAALDGTLEIAAADASGTLTTVAAFAPLLLVGGLAAVFLRPFGFTVASALLASLLLSLTVVPVLLARSGSDLGASHRPGPRLVAWIAARLEAFGRHALARRRRTLVIAAVIGLCLAVTPLLRHGPVTLLPNVDEGALLVEYVLPPGVSLAESQRIASQLTAIARRLPDVLLVESRVGAPAGGAEVEGVNRGELLIKLATLSERTYPAAEVIEQLRAASASLDGVVLLIHQPTQEKMDESFSGLPAPFGVTVYGTDQPTLEIAASQVAALLRADPAVSAVIDNWRFHSPELTARLDGERCAALDVDPAAARTTVAAAVWGAPVLEIAREGETVPVRVRLGDGVSVTDDLATVPVTTADGSWVPLAAIADLQVRRVAPEITRLNGRRELTVLAEITGDLPREAARIQRLLDALELPASTDAVVGGQFTTLVATGRDLLLVLIGAALLILAIMAFQLRSLRQAAWILATTPAALAGAGAGIALTATGLNIAIAAGVLTLLGIGVNNGIVLLDFASKARRTGADGATAVLTAVRIRLRPILATSLTTIAALAPSALGLGAGQHVFQPFAVTVISGLVVGTIATLAVLPAAVSAGTR